MAPSAPAARRRRAFAHPIDHELGKFRGGAVDGSAFLAVPVGCCVAHAQDRQRREPGIQIGTEFPLSDALLDDVLEYALKSARPPTDATAALSGKMLTLIEEDADEVGPVDQRRKMRFDQ